MGATLLNMKRKGKYMLGVDNQAAIQTTRQENAISGQRLVDALHKQTERFTWQQGVEVILQWTPGPEGIKGNERAGEEAKKAAKGTSCEEYYIPIEGDASLEARRPKCRDSRKEITKEANAIFVKSPRAMIEHKINPSMPSTAFIKLCAPIPRRHATLLVRLRTPHIPLNKHLFSIGKSASPKCPAYACKAADETVQHFLFHCPKYRTQRQQLEKEVRRGAISAKV
jgi:hypothetical protein